MYVSEINNNAKYMNFAARVPKAEKVAKVGEAVLYLPGEMSSQVVTISRVVEKLHGALRKLEVQKNNSAAQGFLEDLRANHGLREVFETRAEGLVLGLGNDKNLIVSSHGYNSLRLREQNARTGEVENSIWIRDKKVVKNDARQEIPEHFDYLKTSDIKSGGFIDDLQEKLNVADFSLLKVRRELFKPEVQLEISKVSLAQISPVNILKSTNIVPASEVETSLGIIQPKLQNVQAAEPSVEKVVRRRGRPKGSGKKAVSEETELPLNNSAEVKPKRGRKPKSETKMAVTPEQVLRYFTDQVEQLQADFNMRMKYLMADFIVATSESFRAFEKTTNKKINELQLNLKKFIENKS